jgi:hypothetical protein
MLVLDLNTRVHGWYDVGVLCVQGNERMVTAKSLRQFGCRTGCEKIDGQVSQCNTAVNNTNEPVAFIYRTNSGQLPQATPSNAHTPPRPATHS